MLKYHLDHFGWYQFETLIQSLLKAELNMAIEAWGGHSDWGRDAYAVTELPFPIRKKNSAGPFVFQAKFVEAANAKGAKPQKALLGAVKAEAEESILERRMGIGRTQNGTFCSRIALCIRPHERQSLKL